MHKNLLNQIEQNSSKMLFGLVCQNAFGTDCLFQFKHVKLHVVLSSQYYTQLTENFKSKHASKIYKSNPYFACTPLILQNIKIKIHKLIIYIIQCSIRKINNVL